MQIAIWGILQENGLWGKHDSNKVHLTEVGQGSVGLLLAFAAGRHGCQALATRPSDLRNCEASRTGSCSYLCSKFYFNAHWQTGKRHR